MRRQGAKVWTSRSHFINTDATSPVDILKSSDCKKDHLQNAGSLTNDVTLHDKNTEVKSPNTLKRFSDIIGAFRSPLVTSVSPDDVNNLLDVYAKENNLNRAVSRDSGLDQSPENVTFNSSESSNCDQLAHDIGLDESGFSFDTSQSAEPSPSATDLTSPIQEKELSWLNSPITLMSPETEFNNEMNVSDSVDTGEKTFEIGEILNPRSPFTLNLEGQGNFPLVQMVCREILMTERSYVHDLKEVIEGYIGHLKQNCEDDDHYIFDIFGNLEDIYDFNKEVLAELEQCEVSESEIDPIKLANVFCEKTSGFNQCYTQYCTEYPEAASTFRYILQDQNVAKYFSERQASIGHALSLESYLLKPVQRILKYNLLLKDILKKYEGDEAGYNIINTALDAMSDVAEYINEMKRLHENAVKVDQILDNLKDTDDGANQFDRYMTGKFVLENSFKVNGIRGDRTILILFEKMLIMCKRTEEKQLHLKERLECSNMMLIESMHKEPLGFQLLRFDNQKDTYTIVAKTLEIKKEWTQHIKRLILENHAAMIPQTARQAILGQEEAKSKYNSLPMQALDNTGVNTLRKPNLKSPKSPNVKEAGVPIGAKRESNEKETSKEPKRHLRPLDFLADKKGRTNVTSPTGNVPEKEKKEKWWVRHKPKPSLDSALNLEANADKSENIADEGVRQLSRSLESLQDAIKQNDDADYKEKEEPANATADSECTCESEVTSKISIRNRSKSAITGPLSFLAEEGKDTEGEECLDDKITNKEGLHDKIGKDGSANVSDRSKTNDQKSEHSSALNYGISDEPISPTNEGLIQGDIDGDAVASVTPSPTPGENNSASQIRNLADKVNGIFNTSSGTTSNGLSNGVSPMFFSPVQSECEDSAETTVNENSNSVPSSTETNTNETSGCSTKDDVTLKAVASESESVILSSSDDHPPFEDDDCEVFESDDTWSTNVDALLNEVNADLHSIAGSIASDTAKSNESGSDFNTTPTDSASSIGVNLNENKNEQDRNEAGGDESIVPTENVIEGNESIVPPENVVQVRQVADRIKEYRRLADAEKRRLSWTQREPKDISEMIESLDSIQSVDTALSPTYSSLRRRFRPSRDYSGSRDSRSSDDYSRIISPLIEGAVDTYRPDTPIVELNTKYGESKSQGSRPTLPPALENVGEANESRVETIDIGKNNRHSSSYEYVETVPKTPETVATATIISTTPKEGHVLSEKIALDHVFYTNEDDRKSKAQSLPLDIYTSELHKLQRKISDTERTENGKYLSTCNKRSSETTLPKTNEQCPRAWRTPEQPKKKAAIQKPKTPTFTTCDFKPSLLRSDLLYNHKSESNLHVEKSGECNELVSTQQEDIALPCKNVMEKSEIVTQHSTTNNVKLDECKSIDICSYVEHGNNTVKCEKENNAKKGDPSGDLGKHEQTNSCKTSNEKDISCRRDYTPKEPPPTERVINSPEVRDRSNVVRMSKDNEKKVFRISKDGSIYEKKVHASDKSNTKEQVERKGSGHQISGKTLITRSDSADKSNVGPHEERKLSASACVYRQDRNDKNENRSMKTSSSSSNCSFSLPGSAGVRSLSVTDLRERRNKSVSITPSRIEPTSQSTNRFTTETYINVENRSLRKTNSSPLKSAGTPPLVKGRSGDSIVRDNGYVTANENKAVVMKAPGIVHRQPIVLKKLPRSVSMPSVNGIPSPTEVKRKVSVKQEQITQLKCNLDNCVSNETQRGRSGEVRHVKPSKNSTETNTTHQRSTSLPRRRSNFLLLPNETVDESNKTEKYVLRSPSIRHIQQNHVNNRIKDYFVNLEKSSEISHSRPDLLLVDSESDSESSAEENNPNLPLADASDDSVHIYRGTVRSMIKKYGQTNFVFD